MARESHVSLHGVMVRETQGALPLARLLGWFRVQLGLHCSCFRRLVS